MLFMSSSKGAAGGVIGQWWLLLPDTTSIVSGIRECQHRPLTYSPIHSAWCGSAKDIAHY